MSAGRQISEAQVDAALGPFVHMTAVGAPSGSGECWRAERPNGEIVAVKLLVRQHEPGRFAREVEALKRVVNSPRVMRVFDSGTTSIGGKDYPYLISEFVDGRDVRTQINARASTSDADLRSFVVGCLEGLDALAAADIVHRDIKPENIVLRNGSWAEPVIIDLGLSRLLDISSMTIYPWAGGTWPYMAPEQMRGERAITRSDIWALAVVTGELADGSHPFWQGEPSPPGDWQGRLQRGVQVSGSRPAALADWMRAASDYRAYRRPDAATSLTEIGRTWP